MAANHLSFSGKNKNSFVLVSRCVEHGGGLRQVRVLLLSRTSARQGSEPEEYSFLQYMKVKYPTVVVDYMLRCIRIARSTDNRMQHLLRYGTRKLKPKQSTFLRSVWDRAFADSTTLLERSKSQSCHCFIYGKDSVVNAAFLLEQFSQ